MSISKKWSLGILCLLMACIFSAITLHSQASFAGSNTSIQQYDQTPGAVKSPITVAVNGQSIFVEKYKDVHYARFAFRGTVRIDVNLGRIADYTISPRAYNIQSKRNGDTISFTLTTARKLILQSGNTKLFILADPLETNAPHLGSANVINIQQYVKDTRGRQDQTANIQRALDAAAKTRGIVYFPKGTYLTGTVKIPSNVAVYLSSGALLSGVSSARSFSEGNFVVFDGASNSKLYGRGTIDAHGKQLREQGSKGRIKILRTIRASNIKIQDVLLRDSGSWTVHLAGSTNVKITNLKLMNDMTNTNGDGIDPDASRNITVDGAFIYTTDDCFAVKTSGVFKTLQSSNDILIKNSVCYTKKSALKVGTETKANLTNVTFENNAVVHADRVISLYMADGSTLQNVVYNNNSSEVVGGDSKQRLIDISITKRAGVGYIRNVQITNYIAYNFSPKPSSIVGMNGHTIDVTFKHFVIAGKVQTSADSARIKASTAKLTFLR